MKRPQVRTCVWLCCVMLLLFSAASAQVSFTGQELLGSPTDHSVTINVVPSAAIDAYFQYGTQPGGPYTLTSPPAGAAGPVSTTANVPLVVVLGGLQANTQYFYRMVYRATGTTNWITRDEHYFFTQRQPGTPFTFTITSDSHLNNIFGTGTLFTQTMQNILGEKPDFSLDLGDTFPMDSVTTQAQANSTYLGMRPYFDVIGNSVPVFLALGNHAEEERWHLDDTGNIATSQPVMGANARKMYYPNPDPLVDPFYTGNTDTSVSVLNGDHTIQDYYAWQWGDALFVVFDPYWYTSVKPFIGNTGGGEASDPGSGDRWDWSLGIDQYLWLKQTLAGSNAKYKFLFAHQVAGGMDDYGRGGANAVPFVEWGGYDTNGTTQTFASHRPGWAEPVEQLLIDNNVTVVFHGHDHQFAYEKRDGIVYQLIPMAADATYGLGFNDYHETDPYTLKVLPNTGHLRVTVNPSQVTVDYVKSYLPGDGTNGQVAYTYTVTPQNAAADFTLTATPGTQTVTQGGSTTYTASVGALNGFTGTAALSISGLPNGAGGSFSPASIVTSGNSTLTVTTSSTTPTGTYTLTITGASGGISRTATVSLTVNAAAVPDFTLSATPGTQTVTQGNATSYTANLTFLNGFNSAVGLSVSGLPSGANGTFTTTPVTGSGTSTLNVTTSPTTPSGAFTLTITGTGGGQTHTATVTLVVNAAPQPDFTLSATPGTQTVTQGGSTSYIATIGAVNGFNAATALSITGLPTGANGTFTSTPVTGAGTSTLNVTTSSTTPAGSYALTIKGASGNLNHTATVTLVVNSTSGTPDFSLTVTPPSQTVAQGGTTTYTIQIAALNGFTGTVSLDGTGLPGGASGAFSTTSINGSGTSTVTIRPNNIATGSYALTVIATSGSVRHTANITLVVSNTAQPDFSLSASPGSQTVTRGGSTSYTSTVTALNGFTAATTLTVSGLPTGASGTFTSNPVTGAGTSTLNVTTSSTTPTGTYTLTIQGTSGSLTHTTPVTLVVNAPATPDFSLSASPSSRTVTQGGSTSYTATLGAVNGFNSATTLTVTGLPTGTSGIFTANPVTGAGTSTLNVTTSSTTPTGSYPLTITGTSGNLTHATTVTLVVNAAPQPDFTLTASPSTQTVTQGGSTSYTATLGALNGFTGATTLTVTGLPTGASGTFTANPVTGAGASTLNVTTSSSTPAGSYTVSIKGTSGSLSHTATVTLVVNSTSGTADFSLAVTPSSQTVAQGGTTTYTVQITALNGFTGTVSLDGSGLPGGASGAFSTTSIRGSGASTVTIRPNTIATGTYSLTVIGTSGSLRHTATMTLVVTR